MKCKVKIGESRCDLKYYSSGFCRRHYFAEFSNNRKNFGQWGVRR